MVLAPTVRLILLSNTLSTHSSFFKSRIVTANPVSIDLGFQNVQACAYLLANVVARLRDNPIIVEILGVPTKINPGDPVLPVSTKGLSDDIFLDGFEGP